MKLSSVFLILAAALSARGENRPTEGNGSPATPKASDEKPQDNVVTIPLDQIWAYNMPGTRDIRELEPDVYGDVLRSLDANERDRRFEASLVKQIVGTLNYLAPLKEKDAGRGFAVMGTGVDALENAHSVLVAGREQPQLFSTSDEISIVFCSHSFGSYVHVERAERRRNLIDIQYRFVPHRTKEMTRHFALIPCGRLPAATYVVEMTQLPLKTLRSDHTSKHVSSGRVSRIVCDSFSFSISNTNGDK